MKKKIFKGFTLIELLAAILILGIIALITAIVVTGIIRDSKKSGVTLSVKSYISTINDNILSAKLRDENISDGTYKILSNGNLCIGTYSNSQCDGEILDLNLEHGKPISGEVIIADKKVTKVINANINGETISYDAVKNQEIISDAVLVDEFNVIRYINSIKINFTATNATSYKCEYGLTENYGSEGIINSAKTECMINDLTPGTLYYYKLTVSANGNKSDVKKGAITTLPLSVNPVIALSPAGFSETKTATISYSSGTDDARIINPKYYFYTTSAATSNIEVAACGTDFEPKECGVVKTSTLKANTWYTLGENQNGVVITYLINSTLIAKTNENNIAVGSNQALITTIDNAKPTIIANNIKYGQNASLQLYDNQSGIKYFAVTNSENLPSTTSSTSGSSLNTWYPIGEVNTTERITKEFPGLDAGIYYAWAQDELGYYDSVRFVVEKANDVITIASVTKTYDRVAITPNISTLSGLTTTNTYYSDNTCTTVANPINAGDYYVIATTIGNNNYKSATSECIKVAQINKLTIAAATTCESSKIYDGTSTATCTIAVSNKVGTDNVSVTPSACNYNNANVGTNKTITCTSLALSGSSSSNYQLGSSSTTTKGNIYNATLAFNADGGTISGTTPLYVRKGSTGFFTGIANSTLGASPNATKTGYTFDGWFIGNIKVIDPTVTFNGTKVAAGNNDTHKGIVYLDPTDLSRTCTAALSDANLNGNNTPTGINSGCMKFYIYDDEGSTYKMILDHNTSGNVAWNSDGTTTTMNEVATRLYADTLGWVGNPRLISADEIAHIVGADTSLQWAQDKPWGTTIGTQAAWFYLDGSGNVYSGWQTQTANETNKSRYAWLYDNIYGCSTNGCNIQDSNTYPYPTMNSSTDSGIYGYWTSNTVFDDATCAWRINRQGSMNCNSITINNDYGVRPVIAIPKSIIDGTNPIQASVANWTDADSKWLLTTNAELTAKYSVNKYKATFYSELITNGDFSDTTGTGWQTKENGSYGVDSTVKNGTMNAMRITTDVNNWSGIKTTYNVDYKPNTTYKISFKAYRDSSSSFGDQTRTLRVYLPERNSSSVLNYYVVSVDPSDLPDKTWKEFSRTFTTSSGTGLYFDPLCLDFYKTTGRTNIWVSDVKVEEVTERYLDYDAQLGALPTTTRTGYTSGGYYTARNGSGTQISASTRMGAANASYYEKWIANPYTVVFNGNGSTSGSMSNQSISYNTNQALNSNAYTREGFTFVGWTTALNYTELVNDPTEYNSSGQFNIKQYTISGPFKSGDVYQLDFDAKGSGTLTTYFYGEDNYLDVQEVINSDGWRLNTSTPFRDGNNDINLTSSYKHYTVQFTLGSSGDPTVTKYILFRTLNYNSVSFKNIVFKRVGNAVYDPNVRSGDATSLASGYVGIAQYTVPGPFSPGETYEVEFDAKGSGKLTTYFYGASNYLQIANSTNSDGWNNSYTDGYNDIVLTNNYTHYVVRFTLGSIGSTTVEKYLLFRVFAGYKADVKNVKMKKVATYANGATVRNLTVPGRTVNLYAMWEPNYTRVDFNANGGTLSGTSPVYVNFGDSNVYADLLGNTYAQVPTVSRNGYVYKGWYTNANAMDLGYAPYKTPGVVRVNFANEHYSANGWAMTSADQGTHVQAKVSVTDANITTQPTVQFNDVPLSPVHVDHVGNTWTFYIDFDISAQMLSNAQYPYDTVYRFIDIEHASITSSTQLSVDTLVKGGKKYYDESGNSTFFMDIKQNTTLYAKFADTTGPSYTSAEVKNLSSTGYDVYVYGVTDPSGVNRVQFPTWTAYNSQDDIQANWQTSSAATGTKQSDGTTWIYRVNTTAHNNEAGVYHTHIYLYDNLGNPTVLVASNTTVYNNNSGAVTVPTVTATFNANGGNTPNPTSITKAYNNALGTLPSVSRPGYTFDGWFTAASGGTQISSSTVMPATGPEYFAHWTIKTHTVTCEDYFVDASNNRKVKLGSGTKTYNYGATASGADWGTDTSSLSVYYSYYVYRSSTSGTVPDNDNLVVYRYFWGWTDLNIFYAGGSTQGGATVNFKVGNGSWADVTNESNTTQPWGTTYYIRNIRPVNSTTEELSSVSNLTWDSNNQYYYYTPTSAGTSMSIYMKYKIFSISLDKQDGSGGTSTIYEKYNTGYYTNNTATTQMTTGANAISVPSRTGYTFGGYYTGTNGSGTQYINASGYLTSSASATNFTAAGSLYAKWTVVPYTISYNLNGGSVANANPTTYNVNSGNITLNNPERPGYTFTGWSGTGLSGSSNTSVTISSGSTGNRSYTANWSAINYSISYDLKDGTVSNPNPTSYNIGSSAITLRNPTKAGVTFTGWTGSNGSTPQTTVTIPNGSTGNKSYTANYNQYFVTYNINRGEVTFNKSSNEYLNTGIIIDYSKDFTLRARVNCPSNTNGQRHQIFGNYNAMSVKQDLGIEFNENNKLRVWMNYDGNSSNGHAAWVFDGTSIALGVDIDVVFTWTASTQTYTLTTSGTNSNNSVSRQNTNMTGVSSYPLLIGTKDQRSGNATYSNITFKSASYTIKYNAGAALSNLMTPSNSTSQNYVFHGWYTATGGQGTQATTSTTVNRDITYYGHWTNEALWMSAPSTDKGLVTGTGNDTSSGYVTGTTFTFTCNGDSSHKPTSLTIKNGSTVVATATNSSATTLSKSYTVTSPGSSVSINASCTDGSKTVTAAAPTRHVFRKFALYYNSNGATLSGGDSTTNSVQYLRGDNTTLDGGHPVKLYSVSRAAKGLGSTAYGFTTGSTVLTSSPPWGKNGSTVNIYYGTGTQSANVVYASYNYNAERTIYAVSQFKIYNPTKSSAAQTGMVLLTADSTYLYLWNTLQGETSTYYNTCPANKPKLQIQPYGGGSYSYITICNGAGATCGINLSSNDYFTRQLSNGSAYYSYGWCVQ